MAMIGRLADQKGFDLVAERDPAVGRVVARAMGDPGHRRAAVSRVASPTSPSSIRTRSPCGSSFSNELAHRIEAGADIFLMPSRYEPCGLNQLYSLKYGTVPVVHATGGLADTITNLTDETLAAGTANGFSFDNYTPVALARRSSERARRTSIARSGSNSSAPACSKIGRGTTAPRNTAGCTS